MHVDSSSLSYFHGQVITDSNLTTNVTLKGTEEILSLTIFSAADEALGGLGNLVVRFADDIFDSCGDFFSVIDEGLAGVFKIIGKLIHKILGLEEWDKILKNMLAGGLAKFLDVVTDFIGSIINQIKETLKDAQDMIEKVGEFFELIDGVEETMARVLFGLLIDDVDETINNVFGQTTTEQTKVRFGFDDSI